MVGLCRSARGVGRRKARSVSRSTARWPQGHGDHARTLRGLLFWGGLVGLVGALVVGVAGSPAAGQQPDPQAVQLYQANCAFCHGVDGTGTFRGTSLVGVGKASVDFYLRSGRMPINDPSDPITRSEPKFSDEQIRKLVEYVGTFGTGPPIPTLNLDQANLARGEQLYQLNCAACHNWDGKGGALIGVLASPLRAVPPIQLAEAIRIGPGPMPLFPPDVLNDQELNDVVAYSTYLKKPLDAGGYGLAHWGPATEGLAGTVGLLILLLVTFWLGKRA
jgi:ubiquinol-cytochrome c reductase cytochrome c subunit